jgi:nucleotide-binding universal stress UspA family protein
MFEHVVVAAHFASANSPLFDSLKDLHACGARELTLVDVLRSHHSDSHDSGTRELATKRLQEQRTQLEAAGFRVNIEVTTGQPAQEIFNLARRHGASLILAGSRGEHHLREFLRGSTILQLVRKSTLPTLIEPIEAQYHQVRGRGFKRLLLATDFSGRGSPAEEVMLGLAAGADQLVLSHVIDEDLVEVFGEDQARAAAHEKLRRLAARLPASSPTPILEVVAGTPSREILRLAEIHDTSTIIMGKRGDGPVAEVLLGSTTDAVIREASCAVLMVPQRGVSTDS